VNRPVISVIRIGSIAPRRIPVARVKSIPPTEYEYDIIGMAVPPTLIVPFGVIVAKCRILLALPVLASLDVSALLEVYGCEFCRSRVRWQLEILHLVWLACCCSLAGCREFAGCRRRSSLPWLACTRYFSDLRWLARFSFVGSHGGLALLALLSLIGSHGGLALLALLSLIGSHGGLALLALLSLVGSHGGLALLTSTRRFACSF